MKSILIILVLIASIMTSCAPAPSNNTTISHSFGDVLNVIFDAYSARVQDTGQFQAIQGNSTLLFKGTAQQGTFSIVYNNFDIPQGCPYQQNCVCNGTVVGSFVAATAPPQTTTTTTVPVYNPISTTTTAPVPANDSGASTVYLTIVIDYQNSSLSSGCPTQFDRVDKLQINSDMSLILTDLNRDVYWAPRKH